jgi:hypothetical protein
VPGRRPDAVVLLRNGAVVAMLTEPDDVRAYERIAPSCSFSLRARYKSVGRERRCLTTRHSAESSAGFRLCRQSEGNDMLMLAAATGFFVFSIVLVIAVRTKVRFAEDQKRTLDAISVALQIGALVAGGLWVAAKYAAGEADVLTIRVAPDLKVDPAAVSVGGKSFCRLVVTWSVKNDGLRSADIVRSTLSVRRFSLEDLVLKAKTPEFVEDEDYIAKLPALVYEAGPADDRLKPGAIASWSRGVMMAHARESKYRIDVEIWLKGDPKPWRLSSVSYCP